LRLRALRKFIKDLLAPLLTGIIGPKYTLRNKDKSQRSLIDYICIPEFLVNDIPKLEVRDDCQDEFSDHYPISMSLNTLISNMVSDTDEIFHTGYTNLHTYVILWLKLCCSVQYYSYYNRQKFIDFCLVHLYFKFIRFIPIKYMTT
jgi:hypothetical protein